MAALLTNLARRMARQVNEHLMTMNRPALHPEFLSDPQVRSVQVNACCRSYVTFIVFTLKEEYGFDWVRWIRARHLPDIRFTTEDIWSYLDDILDYDGYPFPPATTYNFCHDLKMSHRMGKKMHYIIPDPFKHEEEAAYDKILMVMGDMLGHWNDDEMKLRYEFYEDCSKMPHYEPLQQDSDDDCIIWDPVIDPPVLEERGGTPPSSDDDETNEDASKQLAKTGAATASVPFQLDPDISAVASSPGDSPNNSPSDDGLGQFLRQPSDEEATILFDRSPIASPVTKKAKPNTPDTAHNSSFCGFTDLEEATRELNSSSDDSTFFASK